MTKEEAHKLVDKLFDNEHTPQPEEGVRGIVGGPIFTDKGVEINGEPVTEKRVLPEGQRVVRTKLSGDKVYLLDDNKKTRAWITTGEVLTALGFQMGDVVNVEDSEMMNYQMAAAIYKAPDAT